MPLVSITLDTEFPDRPAADPLSVFDELLAILGVRHVRATFFVVGSWAKAHPDRIKAIREGGHHIGNHGYAHCDLRKMTDSGIVADLTDCRNAMSGAGIETRPWFRAPYGAIGEPGGRIHYAIEQAGYRHIGWHANGDDWKSGRSVDEIVRKTLADVYQRWPEPAIVLFHSWPDPTPDALAQVLDGLRSSGAEFVTVPELGGAEASARLSRRSGVAAFRRTLERMRS